jgi:mono/diheme cytochrome c family protein
MMTKVTGRSLRDANGPDHESGYGEARSIFLKCAGTLLRGRRYYVALERANALRKARHEKARQPPSRAFSFSPHDLDQRSTAVTALVCRMLLQASALMLGFVVALAPPVQAQQTGNVKRGQAFAEEHCAICHAVGRGGSSPYAPAPPFRTLHLKYDVANLAEAFAEGIIVSHNGPRQMPQFMLSPGEIDDLIAYLKSLELP